MLSLCLAQSKQHCCYFGLGREVIWRPTTYQLNGRYIIIKALWKRADMLIGVLLLIIKNTLAHRHTCKQVHKQTNQHSAHIHIRRNTHKHTHTVLQHVWHCLPDCLPDCKLMSHSLGTSTNNEIIQEQAFHMSQCTMDGVHNNTTSRGLCSSME